MGWSGGIFTRVHDWTEDEAGGYDILSTRMDEEDDNFESGVNACLHKGGQNTPTDNLPMGGKIHTGVGTGTARDNYSNIGQVQDGAFRYGSAFNNLNAYTLVLSPAPAGYVAGQQFNFKPSNTNSGAVTLNVNSLGAKDVYYNGAACPSGTIVGGRVYTVIYDGTRFHLVGAGGGGGASYGGAKICMTSSQDITFNTPETVEFRVELYDDSNYYTAGNDGLQIPVNGRYRVTAFIRWAGGTDFGEAVAVAVMTVNGTRWFAASPVVAIPAFYTAGPYYSTPDINLAWEGLLTKDDVVTIKVTQSNTTASARAVVGDGTEAQSSWLAIERIL